MEILPGFTQRPEAPRPSAERVEILSHLWMVDRICLFDSPTVGPVLELLRPDVHAKGTDYTAADVPEAAVDRLLEYSQRASLVDFFAVHP